MANHKHLTLEDRITIQTMLNEKSSLSQIAKALNKNPNTVSREIRNRLVYLQTGSLHRKHNSCVHRYNCEKQKICEKCISDVKYAYCRSCPQCNRTCDEYEKYDCKKLLKPPYVCNGCNSRSSCTLEKRVYKAVAADKEYRTILSELRSGTSFSEEEISYLDSLITPLIQQKQSPHHICSANPDTIMVSERTIYRMIDSQLISAKNLDLPRKVRFRPRKKRIQMKVDKGCRIGRNIQDYLSFINDHPDYPVVQLDSVEGKKGGKVLLTIHFVKTELMLAFLRDRNDSKSVIDIFEMLYSILGPVQFKKIFKVCLADNGSEFSNPKAIEFDSSSERRTYIFYCDPNAPQQKGSAERNHEFIRMFIPKGVDIGLYSQNDISLMMDHINSYSRESLGDRCPYDTFAFLYGEDVLNKLSCNKIPPREVTLSKSIFRSGGKNV